VNADGRLYRADLETASAADLRARQRDRLKQLWPSLQSSRFYAEKFRGHSFTETWDWETFGRLPFTTKAELVADQQMHPPFGSIASHSPDGYVKYHQTSGTQGKPLAVVDTRDSWAWWTECWQYVYAAAGVTPRDRIFFAFSFGPFIGFWSAYDAAQRLGAMTIPAGGLGSKVRLEMIAATRPTVLLATVTYALRLAEVAAEQGLHLGDLGVRTTIHAGEPGASVPSIRARVEAAWGASCYDHAGATEVGAYGYSCREKRGLHVNEAEFIAEIIDPASGRSCAEGERGELVLTNLGRAGWPVIRYRTGDVVEHGGRSCPCGRTFLFLPGGIIGRIDDLMIVRGVNIYPSALEAIVRDFPVQEFRIVRHVRHQMEEVGLEIEGSDAVQRALADALQSRLGVRIGVTGVPDGSLPRFELKARRVVDRRGPD
jgi:phenylacetate-CoA ligase